MTTATQTPGEKLETVPKKNPSDATSKRFTVTRSKSLKHRLPQARCFFPRFRRRLPVAAEGRLQVTSPIQKWKQQPHSQAWGPLND
jgi:hypothetical protein